MPYLRTAHPDEPATRVLLEGLAEEYARLYGEAAAGELSTPQADDFTPPRGVLLLLVDGSETLAGGGVSPLADGVAEIKGMWTSPAHRGRGYARRVLLALERRAFYLGYRRLRLETGAASAPALALYRSAGYLPAPPFGSDREESLALGFEKPLASPPERISVRCAPRARSALAA
jgi:ribosomal protein S18 acetylase RimI-like enzyme